MHPRRDEDLIQNPLEPDRQTHIAVVEKRVALKYEFVADECSKRHANQRDLKNTKQGGKEYFAEVKPESGGYVEVGVKVMDIMKTPQQRHFMIRQMPIIKA